VAEENLVLSKNYPIITHTSHQSRFPNVKLNTSFTKSRHLTTNKSGGTAVKLHSFSCPISKRYLYLCFFKSQRCWKVSIVMQYWIQSKRENIRKEIQGQSMWDFPWTKWNWNRFFPEYVHFSSSVLPTVLQIHLISKLLLKKGTADEACEPSNKTVVFRKSGSN
jgi:hypothetical protein